MTKERGVTKQFDFRKGFHVGHVKGDALTCAH